MSYVPLFDAPKPHFHTTQGQLAVGAKLYVYEHNSDFLVETYKDSSGSVKNTNPIVMNLRGEPSDPIYVDEDGVYKIRLVDDQGIHFTIDNVSAVGKTGSSGQKGEKGDKGDQGPKGDKGDTGAQGPKGEKGEKGDRGSTGSQGIKGDKGDKGDPGSNGNTGAQGPKGDKGEKGDTGAQGPQGPKGDTGATGATGEQGPKGDTGATGATGPQGPKGDKGDKGDSAVMGFASFRSYGDASRVPTSEWGMVAVRTSVFQKIESTEAYVDSGLMVVNPGIWQVSYEVAIKCVQFGTTIDNLTFCLSSHDGDMLIDGVRSILVDSTYADERFVEFQPRLIKLTSKKWLYVSASMTGTGVHNAQLTQFTFVKVGNA